MSTTRKELRESTVQLANSLSRQELAKFGITRVAELTGLDSIGVPVFTAVRPLSASISIHAGKGLNRYFARAGAILEAIEFNTAEYPEGEFGIHRACEIPEDERLPLEDCFPARASIVNDYTQLAWEEVVNIQNGATKLVPSDLIWLTPRIKDQPFLYLQMGSNGMAAGGSTEDAILSGLYEILERDAWTCHQFILDNCGIMPVRTPLINMPPRVESLVRKIETAGAKLHLFDVTNDYRVPVFSAMILDKTQHCAGTFGGFGAHLNAEIAAIRAITEAIQGRACYISGARDDLFRRQFLLMKRVDQEQLDNMFSELKAGNSLSDYRDVQFPDTRTELRYLLKMVKTTGVSEVFVRTLGTHLDGRIHVVRVFSPQCEPFRFDHHQPGLRCLSYAKRCVEEAKKEGEWTR